MCFLAKLDARHLPNNTFALALNLNLIMLSCHMLFLNSLKKPREYLDRARLNFRPTLTDYR
jgi:hypothetical protein